MKTLRVMIFILADRNKHNNNMQEHKTKMQLSIPAKIRNIINISQVNKGSEGK